MILCTLLIVRFAANSLGCGACCSGLLGGEFFRKLLDALFIGLRARVRAVCSSSVFRVLPVPCAVFLGARGATSLLLYRCLAAAAKPLCLALLAGKGWFLGFDGRGFGVGGAGFWRAADFDRLLWLVWLARRLGLGMNMVSMNNCGFEVGIPAAVGRNPHHRDCRRQLGTFQPTTPPDNHRQLPQTNWTTCSRRGGSTAGCGPMPSMVWLSGDPATTAGY